MPFVWIGVAAGVALGLLGGLIGAYFSIRNTHSPRERKFMIKVAIWVWVGLIIFVALLLGLPRPYGYFMWIPYGVLLPWGIITINRGQQRIRNEDADRDSQNAPENADT